MSYLLALLQEAQAAAPDAAADPIRETVVGFMATYGSIAVGVAFLLEGLKSMWKDALKDRTPILTIVFTFLLGIAAKIVTGFYGPNDFKSWTLHMVTLVFVAVGAGLFHDKILNAVKGKKPPTGGK